MRDLHLPSSEANQVEPSEEDLNAIEQVLAAVVKLQTALVAERAKSGIRDQQRTIVRDYLSNIGRFLDDIGHADDRGVLIQLIGGLDDLDAGAHPRLFAPASKKKPSTTNTILFERAIIAAAVDVAYRSGAHGDLSGAARHVAQIIRKWPEAQGTKQDLAEAVKGWRKTLTREGWEKNPLAREIYDSLRRTGRFSSAKEVLREGARMFGLSDTKV